MATTTISTSMLISSPPSHMPGWKVFPLQLSCPKVGTGVKKKWKVGEGKGRKKTRNNSSETLATQASFEAETGLSVLSDQPSNFKF